MATVTVVTEHCGRWLLGSFPLSLGLFLGLHALTKALQNKNRRFEGVRMLAKIAAGPNLLLLTDLFLIPRV